MEIILEILFEFFGTALLELLWNTLLKPFFAFIGAFTRWVSTRLIKSDKSFYYFWKKDYDNSAYIGMPLTIAVIIGLIQLKKIVP